MMEDGILEKFREMDKAKRQQAGIVRIALLFALVVVLATLFWGWKVSNDAYNKIVVVERSGEYLKTTSEEREKLFISLVKSTCAQLTTYANSFDRATIEENQARALFLCEKEAISQVFALYKSEKSYFEALERGVVYKTELEKVSFIGEKEPYKVKFTSILSIYDGSRESRFRIFSEGGLTKVTPVYPNNTTGLFFSYYEQVIRNVEKGEDGQ